VRANLAIGSTPPARIRRRCSRRRPGRAALRGREAFQEIDQVGTIGGLAKWAAEPTHRGRRWCRDGRGGAAGLGGRPGPVLLSLSEDLLDEPLPDDAPLELARTPTARRRRGDRAVVELLASAAAGHPRRAGVLRARPRPS
jgi:thiamine pyrophosphate-dependent acetolactate synthase large subunit-like protein